ncbi:hypothetical protein N9091_01725 [bacterium]|nr:hypothetical protein [bacterium]
MSVLRRKMFGGGYAHRGTGITSGLAPVRGYATGDLVTDDSELAKAFRERQKLLESIYPEPVPFDRFGANVEPLMKLFSGLMTGKSYQGGLGGGLEIAGEALGEAAPGFGEAIRARKKHEAASRAEKLQMDLLAFKSAEDIIAAKAKASGSAKQNYTTENFKVKIGDITKTLTKITDKTTAEPGEWYDSGGALVSDEDISNMTILGKLGTAGDGKIGETKSVWYLNPNFKTDEKESKENPKYIQSTRRVGTDQVLRIKDNTEGSDTFGDWLNEDMYPSYMVSNPEKLATRKMGDVWIKNPNATDKETSNLYLNSQYKTDEYNNLLIKDPRPGSPTKGEWLPEDNFKDFTLTEPKEAVKSKVAEEKLANVKDLIQAEYDRIAKSTGLTSRKLTDKELDVIVQKAGDDPGEWYKFSSQYGSYNELAEILKPYFDQDVEPKINVGFGETQTTTAVEPDYIDERYNLNKDAPNYEFDRIRAERNYRLLDTIPTAVQESITSAFDGFKDLKLIVDNIDEGVPFFGGLKRITASLGLDFGATEFLTGQDGTLVSATAALVKGIPSDFDVRNLKRILPSIAEGDTVNRVRAKRLQRVYYDIVKNALSFHSGLGNRIPQAIELRAREILGNQAVDEAMATQYTADRLQDIRKLSKEDYIKKYGDPFADSINVLNIPGSSIDATMSDAEKEELEMFEKKFNTLKTK